MRPKVIGTAHSLSLSPKLSLPSSLGIFSSSLPSSCQCSKCQSLNGVCVCSVFNLFTVSETTICSAWNDMKIITIQDAIRSAGGGRETGLVAHHCWPHRYVPLSVQYGLNKTRQEVVSLEQTPTQQPPWSLNGQLLIFGIKFSGPLFVPMLCRHWTDFGVFSLTVLWSISAIHTSFYSILWFSALSSLWYIDQCVLSMMVSTLESFLILSIHLFPFTWL